MSTINITPKTDQRFPLQMWSMNLGLYEVTDDNWHEFFVRVRLYEEFGNAPMLKYSDTNEPVTITPEMAKQHIGCRLGDRNQERDAWWIRIMDNRAKSLEFAVEEFDADVEFPEHDESKF
ncbi:hypothetical protein ACFYP4_02335 [Streptomyces sp. NPDC005551]|uniref:hypothetical protein n=1 Tax=Streptomyces sp. NPDC005551 TaxID=3364725 RepID=UPI003697A6BA